MTPIMSAARHRRLEQVQLLLEHGADVQAHSLRGDSVLHWAARWHGGYNPDGPAIVRLLVQCGAPVDAVNSDGNTPIQVAMSGGSDEYVAKALLDCGAAIDHRNHEG